MCFQDTIKLLTAPAKAASDLHVDKFDGWISFLAVTLSAEVTSSLEKLSGGFGDNCSPGFPSAS